MFCAIIGIVAGILGTLMILVALMAGGANSTPRQIRIIKWSMLITTILGLACAIGGVWLATRGYSWWGGGVAVAPAVVVFVVMMWLTISQEMNRRPPRR